MAEMSDDLRHYSFLKLVSPPQFATTCLPGKSIPTEKQQAGAVCTPQMQSPSVFFKVLMKDCLCKDS